MIIRSKRTQNFTVVPNLILNDQSLDWKELGLLVYLLSKPDEWSVSVAHLTKTRKAGRESILNMLKVLRDAGYVRMDRKAIGGVDYVIFDTPQAEPLSEKATVGKSHYGEKPLSANPLSANPHLVNTDKTIKTEKDLVNTETRELNKKYSFEFPEWIDDEAMDEWLALRKKNKASNSPRALKVLTNHLQEIKNAGIDTTTAIDTAITKGWKTVELSYLQNAGIGASNGTSSKQRPSGQTESAATRSHNRNKAAYEAAIAEEQGLASVRGDAGQVQAQVDFRGR